MERSMLDRRSRISLPNTRSVIQGGANEMAKWTDPTSGGCGASATFLAHSGQTNNHEPIRTCTAAMVGARACGKESSSADLRHRRQGDWTGPAISWRDA